MYCRIKRQRRQFFKRLDRLSNEPHTAHAERVNRASPWTNNSLAVSYHALGDNIASFNAEGDEIGHMPRQVALGVDS
jgi:hypothetical protein